MIQNRTEIGQLFKNRTSKTFELEPDVGVKGGVLQKKSLRPQQILPLTNRMKSKQLYGGLKGRERETLKTKIESIKKTYFSKLLKLTTSIIQIHGKLENNYQIMERLLLFNIPMKEM